MVFLAWRFSLRDFPKDKHYPAFLRFINVAKVRGSGSRRDRSINSMGPQEAANNSTREREDLTGKNVFQLHFLGASLRGDTHFVFPAGSGQRKGG
jgi:hypothetical protein